jgi:hypothetical protein
MWTKQNRDRQVNEKALGSDGGANPFGLPSHETTP